MIIESRKKNQIRLVNSVYCFPSESNKASIRIYNVDRRYGYGMKICLPHPVSQYNTPINRKFTIKYNLISSAEWSVV